MWVAAVAFNAVLLVERSHTNGVPSVIETPALNWPQRWSVLVLRVSSDVENSKLGAALEESQIDDQVQDCNDCDGLG